MNNIASSSSTQQNFKGVYAMSGVDFTINQAVNSLLKNKNLKSTAGDNIKSDDLNHHLIKEIDLKGKKLQFSLKARPQVKYY